MMTSCRYCGRVHPQGQVCPKKPGGAYRRGEPTQADRYRRSRKWQKVRDGILERDYHLCRVCFEGNHGVWPAAGGMQVHHIVPLQEDYSLRSEEGNLISLCPLHHRMAEEGDIGREELRRLAGDPPRWSVGIQGGGR